MSEMIFTVGTWLKAWITFFICTRVAGALIGLGYFFIARTLKLDQQPDQLCQIIIAIIGALISYFIYVWSVKQFLLRKQS